MTDNADPRDDLTVGGSLVTKEPVDLPEVLDLLIVGAGPAGTSAAFRAKELGLSALVIDRDEILTILRDWISPEGNPEKDKTVDSSYGPAGKRVPFPVGGDLVSELRFGDQVPASEVYAKWMKTYVDHSLPAQAGLDLTNLETQDGLLVATCFNQRTREERRYRCRNAILAMGRGVPHTLEIPGDAAGVSYKLRGAEKYAGGPACVIGGGTSAAEAVIAISRTKVALGDETDVIWSYRRRNLPKVNSTLADQFFHAYMTNGNIRYVPFSAPLAVLHHEGEEFVALRSDRREIPGRPTEGSYLEFPKERVLACIGADLPTRFLKSLGVHMLKSADTEEDLMAVSPLFESQVPNVFLIGDLLSPAYIQTTDFSVEAVQSTVIDHTGNFKQGMIDGVLVVEGIKKRLEDAADDKIAGLLEKKRAEFKSLHDEFLEKEKAKDESREAVAAATAAPEPEAPSRVGAIFSWTSQRDGQRASQEVVSEERFLNPGRAVIGRTQGDICFPADDVIVDNHVAIDVDTEACYVTDEGMDGASLVRVNVERTVQVGDLIFVGEQKIKIEQLNSSIFLAVLDPSQPEGQPQRLLAARDGANVYTRKIITPDPEDKRLSRRHFALEIKGTVLTLRDFGSTNGTFIPVAGTVRLYVGDVLYVGSQRFQFDGMETGVAEEPVAAPSAPAVSEPPPAPSKKTATAPTAAKKAAPKKTPKKTPPPTAEEPVGSSATGKPAVSVVNPEIDESFSVSAKMPILDKLGEHGMSTDKPQELGGKCQNLWECKDGMCGLCVIEVISNGESLSKASGKEKRTLRGIVADLNENKGQDLDMASCRLACQAKATGPVKIKLLGDTRA